MTPRAMPAGQASRNRLWQDDAARSSLRTSRVVVVGAGGTGAALAAALAHVGLRSLTLCDPDVLDASSFNRWPFAAPDRVGEPKVTALATYLQRQFPGLSVTPLHARFPDAEVVDALRGATLAAGCVDRAHDRIALDVLCRHLGRTLVDLGAGFVVDESSGRPRHAGGQVFVSRPGDTCLQCVGFLPGVDHGYVPPGHEAAEPSSYLLTTVVGSLAAEVVLGELRDGFAPDNLVTHSRFPPTVTSSRVSGHPDCPVCGPSGPEHLGHLGDRSLLVHGSRSCRT